MGTSRSRQDARLAGRLYVGFGGLAEVAFALWLLFGGDARPRPTRGNGPGS